MRHKLSETKLVLLVILAVLMAAPTFAQIEPRQPFLPFYWLKGNIAYYNVNVPSREIAFYTDNISNSITKESNNNGAYLLNAYELYYYLGVPITFESENYQIDVPRFFVNDIGTREALTLPTVEGYVVKNLALIVGGGTLLYKGKESGSMGGLVTNESGQPVVGVTIKVVDENGNLIRSQVPEAVGTTNNNGVTTLYLTGNGSEIMKVVAANGSLVAGATVVLTGPNNINLTGTTDSNGEFTIQVPANGTGAYNVTVAANGQPASGARVETYRLAAATTDQNGNYSIPNLPSGSYIAKASAAGYDPLQKPVNIVPGQNTPLNFPGLQLSVAVTTTTTTTSTTSTTATTTSTTLEKLTTTTTTTTTTTLEGATTTTTTTTTTTLEGATTTTTTTTTTTLEGATTTTTTTTTTTSTTLKGPGPVLRLNVLLEGFYAAQAKASKVFTVEVEARTGANTADTAVAANLAGRCLTQLNDQGIVANNGSWEVVPAESVINDATTYYYLVIKNKIAGIKAGPNHLPIITKERYPLTAASPLMIDLTLGDKSFKSASGEIDPTKVIDGKKMLWMGDINGDNNITAADSGLWLNLYQRFRSKAVDNPNNPYALGDFNNDAYLTAADYGLWLNNYLAMLGKKYPHGYVP